MENNTKLLLLGAGTILLLTMGKQKRTTNPRRRRNPALPASFPAKVAKKEKELGFTLPKNMTQPEAKALLENSDSPPDDLMINGKMWSNDYVHKERKDALADAEFYSPGDARIFKFKKGYALYHRNYDFQPNPSKGSLKGIQPADIKVATRKLVAGEKYKRQKTTLPGYIIGNGLGVVKWPVPNRKKITYSITHLNSGYRLVEMEKLTEAVTLARELAEAIDWSQYKTTKIPRSVTNKARDIISEFRSTAYNPRSRRNPKGNRIEAAMARYQVKIDALTKEQKDKLNKDLRTSFNDLVQYQNLQARAHAMGKLTTEEAQIIYTAIGEVPSAQRWNKLPLAKKVVITQIMGELLGAKLKNPLDLFTLGGGLATGLGLGTGYAIVNRIANSGPLKGKKNPLKDYTIKFYGRTRGAIGAFHTITDDVKASNKEEAILKLYDKYENVHRPEVREKK